MKVLEQQMQTGMVPSRIKSRPLLLGDTEVLDELMVGMQSVGQMTTGGWGRAFLTPDYMQDFERRNDGDDSRTR